MVFHQHKMAVLQLKSAVQEETHYCQKYTAFNAKRNILICSLSLFFVFFNQIRDLIMSVRFRAQVNINGYGLSEPFFGFSC